jgi:hypothetical protein
MPSLDKMPLITDQHNEQAMNPQSPTFARRIRCTQIELKHTLITSKRILPMNFSR